MNTENRMMPATTAAPSTMGKLSPLVCAKVSQSVLSMIAPPGITGGDLDGVGADDADHHHLGPRGQRFFRRYGLIFHGSILHVEMHLAGPRFLAGHGEIDRPRLADRALNVHVSLGL